MPNSATNHQRLMNLSGNIRPSVGYSVSTGSTWSGLPLKPSASDRAYPLRNPDAGLPLDRSESRAFPVTRKSFLLSTAGLEKDSEAERIRLRKAAEGFEAIFIRQLLKTMRASSTEGGMYGSGATGEMYADIVENALADAMAKEGQFGIADALCRRMSVRESPTGSGSVKMAQEGGGK